MKHKMEGLGEPGTDWTAGSGKRKSGIGMSHSIIFFPSSFVKI